MEIHIVALGSNALHGRQRDVDANEVEDVVASNTLANHKERVHQDALHTQTMGHNRGSTHSEEFREVEFHGEVLQ